MPDPITMTSKMTYRMWGPQGPPVRILAVDADGPCPIVTSSRDGVRTHSADGRFIDRQMESKYDLIPIVDLKVVWLNEYNCWDSAIRPTRELADRIADDHQRIALWKITLDGKTPPEKVWPT